MKKIKCTKCKEERNLEDFHIDLITNKIKRPCVHCCRSRYKKEYPKIDSIENEVWKNVVGYEEFYEISNFGRLKTKQRSLINIRNIERRSQEFLMSPCINKKGYFQCSLSDGKIKKSFLVHRLVALAFIKPLKEKPFVNHIDGNPLNNFVSNLEWCTQKENVIHGFETGLTKSLFGENLLINDNSLMMIDHELTLSFINENHTIPNYENNINAYPHYYHVLIRHLKVIKEKNHIFDEFLEYLYKFDVNDLNAVFDEMDKFNIEYGDRLDYFLYFDWCKKNISIIKKYLLLKINER